MPIRKPLLVNGEIYHVIIRGAGDSLVFRNNQDRFRAIFSLYEFNTTEPVEIKSQRKRRKKSKKNRDPFSDEREILVEIFTFCFMPNHIHLLLRQVKKDGISKFIQKFGAGYVGYFNQKYERKGPLFAKFRAVHIKTDEQLRVVFSYIHINPTSLIEPKWKEKGINSPSRVINFLEKYKWSSYPDYLEKQNFPSLTKREFLSEVMGGKNGAKNFINDWIRHKSDKGEKETLTLLGW